MWRMDSAIRPSTFDYVAHTLSKGNKSSWSRGSGKVKVLVPEQTYPSLLRTYKKPKYLPPDVAQLSKFWMDRPE